jgi:phenylalanyl-tRNA synthetase beta chain
MKISYRWLARHLDLDGISPARVAEDLTLSTAEVEGLERFLPHLSDVVVGFVVKREKHPDAEKLSYCQVDVGASETLGIVCGAPNVASGQKVAVARIGTSLPGDVKIKKSKIRGVESCGMICSERELGLGDEHSGIWVLPADAPVGKPVAEALGLDDWVIEIDNKSLTHRPDLWGHRGFAAEIAAMHGRHLKPLDLEMPKTGGGRAFPVRIEADVARKGGCSRYVAVPIDGVLAQRSPDWLRALLFAVGQRPIDLLVDVSNFVMLDLGQPNHLFDRTRLSPEGIVVRNARVGESMKTLDGVERKLTPDDMLICSGDEPVALAGVMGGEGSKVGAGTSSLLLEVATFHPAIVRRTAQRLALRTDSSARFEKSLDPTLPLKAASHLVRLLRDLQPSLALPAPITDVGAWKDPARRIRLRGDRVRSLLGADVSDTEIADILVRLGFKVERGADEMFVDVPSARATKDITIEQDLVEEVGRIHRYGNIAERNLISTITPLPRDDRRMLVRALKDRLSGAARFHETISYSFVSDALVEQLGQSTHAFVQVVNPVAQGFSRVRRSVLPSLLSLVADNRRHADEVRLFEIGKGYLPEHSSVRGEPREAHELAIVWAAPPPKQGARFDADRLHELQGVLDDVVRAVELPPLEWTPCASEDAPSWAHPGRCLAAAPSSDASKRARTDDAAKRTRAEDTSKRTMEDSSQRARMPDSSHATRDGSFETREPMITLAALEPGLARKLGLVDELSSDVACAVISIDRLLACDKVRRGYRPIPKFPGVKVDVAVAVASATRAGDLVQAIERAGKGMVASSELFDVYSGANIGAGRKSLAFHVTLISESRTLTDQDVAKFLERAERELATLGGELRRE